MCCSVQAGVLPPAGQPGVEVEAVQARVGSPGLVQDQGEGKSTNLLTSQVLSMYRTSQLVMLEYSVPLRLELPTVYLYSALFSHSAGVQHVLLTKKEVFPTPGDGGRV